MDLERPGPFAMILAIVGLFLGSGGVGLWLAATLAPGSFVAEAVSFFALPVAFVIGLQLWYGLAIVGAIGKLIGMALRGSPPQRALRPPPLTGTFIFLPVSSTMGAVAGVIVGLLSPTQPVWMVAMTYWLTGTLHGFLGWRLARAGAFVPPESF